jgi:hypothetical protein
MFFLRWVNSELYLGSNRIGKIEGLSTLTNLRTLWLHDNNIAAVEGAQLLFSLPGGSHFLMSLARHIAQGSKR